MRQGKLKLALLAASLAACVLAQQPARKAPLAGVSAAVSAAGQTSITLYDKKIAVKYSSPSLKGRKVLGGIVPLKQAWPVGGDFPAAFHTEGDLIFKGVVVPKGDYSLYLLADADKWQLIISKQTGQKAKVYDPKMDLGRVPMVLRGAPAPVEICTVTLSKSAARAARLELALQDTIASAPFALDWTPGDPEW